METVLNTYNPKCDTAQPPHRVSIVMQQLGALAASQDETHVALTRLMEALEHALVPTPANVGGIAGSKGEGPVQSPLSDELDRRIAQEHHIRQRIDALTERLSV